MGAGFSLVLGKKLKGVSQVIRRSLGMLLVVFISVLSFSYIQVTGVDVSHYPQVIVFANMDVSDPDNANFYVVEDGNRYRAALSDIKAIIKKPEVDFIIVFDITGSMEDEIQGVKAKIADFADSVKDAGFDYRLSLVTFKDRIVKGDYGFTENVNLFKRWLSSLSASGGGDTPEAALDALMYAMKLPARRDAMKVFILVTDAPYHYKGDGSGVSKYGVEDVRKLMGRFGFTLYSISPETANYKKLVKGHGKVYDIHSPRGISSILDQIAESVTSQIAIVYTTTDEKPSGKEVNFKVEAKYCGEKGSGVYVSCGSYVVPPRPEVENLTIIAEGNAFPDPTKPQAQAILMARQAAILDAKRSILEALSNVKIDKEVTIKDAVMTSEELKTAVNGVIAGGKVIYEENDEEWGYIVKVRVSLEKIYDDILHTTKYVPKWDKKIVVARGIVAINKKIKPAGRAVLLARRGAIAEAQANLLAMIKGIHIDAKTTVEDEMSKSVELTAKLEGVIKGAVVIDEMKNHMSLREIMEKGYYWVSMAAPIDSEGLSYLLKKYGQKLKGSGTILDAITRSPSKPPVSPSTKEKKEYKWMIINANGQKLIVTMKGYILCSRNGRVVYTPSEASDVLPMDILPTMVDATNKHPNSVIYKAIKVDISNSKIFVDADYETLKRLIYDKGIYKHGGITIVSDSLLSSMGGGE